MKNINGKHAVLYARSATQSYEDERYTLPDRQLTEMRAYAERMNLEIVGEFVDEGCSGLRQNYPQLQSALKLIARCKYNVLVVTDLARLSRSWQQIPDLVQTLQQLDVTLVSLVEPEIEYDMTLLERLFDTHSYAASPKKFRRKYRHITNDLPG